MTSKHFSSACRLAFAWLILCNVSSFSEETPPVATVSLTNIEFKPNRLKVAVGDKVRFVNRDKFNHDVYLVRTANRNDVLSPATTIPSGKSIVVTFKGKGLFTLYCTIHGGMTGLITTTGSFELTEEEKARAAARKVVPPIARKGEKLFWSRAQCHQCHRMGNRGTGIRGPNLKDIGFRAAFRAKKLGLESATEYIVQSVMNPGAYLVEGYTNDMATVYQPPIDLNAEELKAIIAYLQSQGGEVDTWSINVPQEKLDTKPTYNPFQKGNAKQGKAVFHSMGCDKCHSVGSHKATSVGPDLTEVGVFRNWTWLAESVIDPNAEVGSNWRNADVYLKSGEILSGMVRKQTAEEIKLLTAPGKIISLPAGKVALVHESQMTKMPANYTQQMNFQQLADLVRYLESLGRKKGESK